MKTSYEPVLFDTNILVYNQDRDSEFYTQASSYHKLAIDGKIKAVVSSQNLLEFSAIMVNPKKITKPLQQRMAASEMEKYIQSEKFGIIYPHAKTMPIFTHLLKKYPLKNPRQTIDLFLVATMIANDIFQILTLNKKDFQFNEIKIIDLA